MWRWNQSRMVEYYIDWGVIMALYPWELCDGNDVTFHVWLPPSVQLPKEMFAILITSFTSKSNRKIHMNNYITLSESSSRNVNCISLLYCIGTEIMHLPVRSVLIYLSSSSYTSQFIRILLFQKFVTGISLQIDSILLL